MSNPTCCGEVIENTALGKTFHYCRGCKQEVQKPLKKRFYTLTDADLPPINYSIHTTGMVVNSAPAAPTPPLPKLPKFQSSGTVLKLNVGAEKFIVIGVDYLKQTYSLFSLSDKTTNDIHWTATENFYHADGPCPNHISGYHAVLGKYVGVCTFCMAKL